MLISSDPELALSRSNYIRLAVLCAGFLVASPAPATAEGDWLTVTDKSLEIEAGSPLDFSALAPALPELRMEADGERLRFGPTDRPVNCATLAPGFSETPKSAFPDHDQAARYAEQLRRHGYNIVRFHYLDALLMGGAKQDFAFDPEQLDRFQYFTSELRKRGIHWIIDILSSENAALGGIFPHRWAQDNHMVARTFLEDDALRHWQELARRLLTTPNPYTGFTLANDPHTALLILVNEPALAFRLGLQTGFSRSAIPPMFLKAYQGWAARRGGPALDPSSSPQNPDFQRFLSDRQISTLRAMAATVRDLGYTGLYTSFDNWPTFDQLPSRQELPLIDMHAYEHDQAPAATPGQKVIPSSSFDDSAAYLQQVAAARIYGKPMILTEHDQVFWNPNRFESGLFAPTFASLQGWQFICRHAAGPINLSFDGQGVRKDAIYTDGGGLDPVARASETLTALLLLRREIAPLTGEVRLNVESTDAIGTLGSKLLPAEVGRLGWLARIGLAPRNAVTRARGIVLDPDAITRQRTARSSVTQKDEPAAQLVGAQAISAASAVGMARGRLEPDGGQISLRTNERQMLVSTRHTAAYAGKAVTVPIIIGPLQIKASDASGLIAFSALDDQPLNLSKRMLIIMAGNARNSGMAVDRNGTLQALGTLPVQIQRMTAQVRLQVAASGMWSFSPLTLTGRRLKTQLFAARNRAIAFMVDTGAGRTDAGAQSPTTYFVLERP